MRTRLLSFLLLIGTTLSAQSITQSWFDSAPAVVNFKAVAATSIDTALTGSGVTWSYGSLTSTGDFTVSNPEPGTIPSGSNFSTADYVPYRQEGNTTAAGFYEVNADSVYQIGLTESFNSIPSLGTFTNPRRFLSLPATNGTSLIDSFRVDLNVNNGTLVFVQRGEHRMVVDGSGTLVTPAGTFQNVLRLRSQSNYRYSGLPPTPGSPTTGVDRNFYWVSAAYPGVNLLTVQFLTEGNTIARASYADLEDVGIDAANAASGIAVFPNPFNELLQVRNALQGQVEVSLCDVSGRVVYRSNHTGDFQIPSADFPSGVYLLTVQSASGVVQRKLIK